MDINPIAFSQLESLRTLNLANNKIAYVPGMPLPQLITLDLRSSHVKSVSQSVVKLSSQLKDFFLDENPIKCSELLSIAEWATPCRSDDESGDNDADTNDNKNANKFPILFNGVDAVRYRSHCDWCPNWQSSPLKKLSNKKNSAKCSTTGVDSRTSSSNNNDTDKQNVKSGAADVDQMNRQNQNRLTKNKSKSKMSLENVSINKNRLTSTVATATESVTVTTQTIVFPPILNQVNDASQNELIASKMLLQNPIASENATKKIEKNVPTMQSTKSVYDATNSSETIKSTSITLSNETKVANEKDNLSEIVTEMSPTTLSSPTTLQMTNEKRKIATKNIANGSSPIPTMSITMATTKTVLISHKMVNKSDTLLESDTVNANNDENPVVKEPNDVIRTQHSTVQSTINERNEYTNILRSSNKQDAKTKDIVTMASKEADDNDTHKIDKTNHNNRSVKTFLMNLPSVKQSTIQDRFDLGTTTPTSMSTATTERSLSTVPTTEAVKATTESATDLNMVSTEVNEKKSIDFESSKRAKFDTTIHVPQRNGIQSMPNNQQHSILANNGNGTNTFDRQSQSEKTNRKATKKIMTSSLVSSANDRNYFSINGEINTNLNGHIKENKVKMDSNGLSTMAATVQSSTEPTARSPISTDFHALAAAKATDAKNVAFTSLNSTKNKQRKLKKIIKTKQKAAFVSLNGNNNNNDNIESVDLSSKSNCTSSSNGENKTGKKCKMNILLVNENQSSMDDDSNAPSDSIETDLMERHRLFMPMNETLRNISAGQFLDETIRAESIPSGTHEPKVNADEAPNGNSDSSTSSGFTEPLNYVREPTDSHSGVFIAIGITIGVFISIALVHLYRCNKPYRRRSQRYGDQNDEQEQYIVPHHSMLPLDTLSGVESRYNDIQIDLW